jgi:hypothetical protein
VRVACRQHNAEIQVSGNGQAAAHGNGVGFGLISMRERAPVYGAHIQAGPYNYSLRTDARGTWMSAPKTARADIRGDR